jgi:hypothetical protein
MFSGRFEGAPTTGRTGILFVTHFYLVCSDTAVVVLLPYGESKRKLNCDVHHVMAANLALMELTGKQLMR